MHHNSLPCDPNRSGGRRCRRQCQSSARMARWLSATCDGTLSSRQAAHIPHNTVSSMVCALWRNARKKCNQLRMLHILCTMCFCSMCYRSEN